MGNSKKEPIIRKTKIICTIGPATSSKEKIKALIMGGMDIARLNTSHSSKKDIINITKKIREISARCRKNTAIMLDLKGPKIRIGKLYREFCLEKGEKIYFTTENNYRSDKGPEGVIPVDYNNFLKDIKKGDAVFIDDGLIECKVLEVQESKKIAVCKVIGGGILKSNKGINLPGVLISTNSVTEKDLDFLSLGIDLGVDFIAQSFVRGADDIKKIKKVINDRNSNIMVIAKIEKHEAVNDFNNILKYADAIMVARGDLGIEVNAEDVPNIQKEIISKSNMVGKPVITATQMLDSMIRNPRPTRAEVSDVANAILDGSDALMLSGETAIGKYPKKVLKMLVKIINKTELNLDYSLILQKKLKLKHQNITEAISIAACEIADSLDAKAIISSTKSGYTAKQISKNRPKSVIIGASPYNWVLRQLMISWGVIPAKTKLVKNVDDMLEETVNVSKDLGCIDKGDKVVITGGVMVNTPGSTNFIKVSEV
ncbi:MAG: pyruvate kinase [Actinobacteria bacterium]|nr:pyruvate kinase [Actinomycetota bacterium]